MTDIQDLLTLENCKSIVKNYLHSQDFTVTSYIINPFTNSLDGLIGEQYRARVSYEQQGKSKSLQLFFKIINGCSTVMFELAKEMKAFEREDFFYNTLVPEFSKFDINITFVPKCYLCVPYTVVLEDLSLAGYKCTKKQKPLDLEHCKKSVELLANLHSSGMIYEHLKSEQLRRSYSLLEDYSDFLEDILFSKEDNPASRWLKCSLEGVFKLTELLPENSVTNNQFKAALRLVLDDLLSDKPNNCKCSITHGDLWSNNFLFKYDDDQITDTKLVDYQTVKYGPVALDVEQFIMTNTRKLFRDVHKSDLLDHYYETFAKITQQQGFTPDEFLSRDDFINSCNAMRIPAKIQAIVDRSITFMSDEIYGEVIKDDELFRRFLFTDRGKYIVKFYTENKDFRELIQEDMLELRDLLFCD